MPFVTAGDLNICYERHGAGPTVLNISGSGGDLRNARPERNPLNRSFDVVHYDQRGLGRTDIPEGPYTMRHYADDAVRLMDALDIEAAHVVGTSFGGMVAQHVAIRYPERVERLVLNCTSPGGALPSFPLHELDKLDIEARIEMKLGLLDNRWDPGADDPIPGLGSFYDVYIERLRNEPTGDAARGSHLQLLARADHDTNARLGEIEAPTLVCAGEYDDQAPLPNSHALVEAIPNARLAVFQGGHLFLMQDRSAFDTIVAFLNGENVNGAANQSASSHSS